MADTAHDHHHRGEMDIHEQQRTFHGFIVATKWCSLFIAILILFPSLLFAANVPFMGALITTIVVLALGIVMLREKRKAAH